MSLFSNIFGTRKKKVEEKTPLMLFNTLSGDKEVFVPLPGKMVRMYNCGPTVYDYQHIGNLVPYVFADTLRRTLEYNGYSVKQIINITDVGHLTSDADEGEDKLEKSAKKEGRKVTEIIKDVSKAFFNDLKKLDIDITRIEFPRATKHIEAQTRLVQTLEEKGYTYKIKDGIYFDTSKFEGYGKLGNIDIEGLKEGARVEKVVEKKNSTDFALWKFSPKVGVRQQEWKSPWGVGFPGWHLECSAMAMTLLGNQIDIHTGGIDHIPIHHNNEIAQSESVTGKQFVKYWLHSAFITIEGKKIAKSVGNTIYLRNVEDKGISPIAFRYWLLTSHYRSNTNFTWEALEGAGSALFRLHKHFVEKLGLPAQAGKVNGAVLVEYQKKFHEAVNDDLDTPKAIALIWELIKDKEISKEDVRATILEFDKVLGLGFSEGNRKLKKMLALKVVPHDDLPKEVQKLVDERSKARKEKDWKKADEARTAIQSKGYTVEDTPRGPKVSKS
jgi:cysteinyl-tRNA synthetase